MEENCSVSVTKTMETSDACPTEDAVQALLEYLVDPLLPIKPSTRDVPSKAEQLSVAKQVHAVVLLYNYYHRRKHPHLEYLGPEAFRKLATVLRPSLLLHMKDSRETVHDDASIQSSILEQVIMNACGLCMSLAPLSDAPSTDNWPIGKVVVFLVDSERKTCYLQHSLITKGVWSLIEKAVDDSHGDSKCKLGQTGTDKKNITTEDQHGDEVKNGHIVFEKLAFSAVEEATGLKQNSITILERHAVYSLSKEGTAARFYIMRCFSENKDLATVPIEDVINSMQGPLFLKNSVWTNTPVVEYFHIIPFSDILADWFSRKEDDGFLEKKAAASVRVDVEGKGKRDLPSEVHVTAEVASTGNENPAEGNWKNEEPKVLTKSVISNRGRSRKRTPSKTAGHGQSCNLNDSHSPKNGLLRNSEITLHARNSDNRTRPCKESDSNGKKNGFEIGSGSKAIQVGADDREKVIQKRKAVLDEPQTADKLHSFHEPNSAAVDAHNSNLNLDSFQALILSKATLLSETARRVLLCKRDELILQQRNIEDEIAKCDRRIKSIARGGDDDWELKLETIIECCNDVYPTRIANETISQQSPDNSVFQSYKRPKLSEPLPSTKSPCQKLDDICYKNNWVLPTYRVSSSDGGFRAEVRLKEIHLEYSTCGDEKPNPEEARDSAASCLLAKLHITYNPRALN